MNAIPANLARVRDQIADAARAAGRAPEDVRLIAVSKTHTLASVESAARAGQHAFGESTVQEALGKIATVPDLEWHFIGHLQSNKAKHIPGTFSWLHSLDSATLAQRLARFAAAQPTPLNVLIEVNVTGDAHKHGVLPSGLFPLLEQLLHEPPPGVALRGLMTIGPHPAKEHERRAAFAALRALRDACRERFALPGFSELSMGMSGDYVEAIKEGSTMVRIGTAIFGARDYGTA